MRKYTWTDVRANEEEYRTIAMQYLHIYQGDFEPLVAIQNAVHNGNELTLAWIKLTLNSMLHDAGCVNMPVPADFKFEPQPVPGSNRRTFLSGSEYAERLIARRPEVTRPAYMDLQATWKKPYGVSRNNRSEVIHMVNPRGSAIRWYPHVEQFQPRLKWICTGQYRDCEKTLLLDVEAAHIWANWEHGQWRFCKTCERIYRFWLEKEWKPPTGWPTFS